MAPPRLLARLLPSVCAAFSALACLPLPAHAAAGARLMQAQGRAIGSGDAVAVRFPRANSSGNLIVVWVVWDNADPVAVSDSRGNAYASAVGPTQADDGTGSQVFYAADVAGGPNTVTATFATPVSAHAALYVHEYAGIARGAPFDAAVAATGSSPFLDSGSLATRSSRELLFMAARCDGRSIARVIRGFRRRAHRGCELTADSTARDAGSYQATAVQSGGAWSVQLVAFQYSGVEPASPRYPVAASGRHLVDQSGEPFLITGDSPQALMVNLSESQARAYFANRARRGFNTVWINLLCATYTGGRADGSTYDGIRPFTNDFDLSTPNEAYFSRVDDMLRLAGQYGLLVLLDPAETGSFLEVLRANGVDRSRAYGRYLGRRYRGFDNIVWMSGNDFDRDHLPFPEDDALAQAVAQGIADADSRHIQTVELNFEVSGSLDDATWAPLIQLNASYTYRPSYAQVLADYNRSNALPTFLVEANYEFEHEAVGERTPRILRRQAYWSLLSGATGQMYGSAFTWPFPRGWQAHLDTRGAIEIGYVKRLFEPRRWWDLVPDQAHAVVTQGYGTFSSSGKVADNDYVTAASTPDGALVMAYLPTARTITVDMSRLAGPAYASWWDPSRGRFRALAGSPLPNAGFLLFSPPSANGDGDDDWVLVLETTPP